jgi:hypothetical protein
MTPEERRKINSNNSTRHGLFKQESRPTAELCRSVVRSQEDVCDQWRTLPMPIEFTKYVLDHFGPRPSPNHILAKIDFHRDWQPGNLAGWVWAPPKERRRDRQAARLDQIGTSRGCACDHRAQEACAGSLRPCSWAEAAMDTAPWHKPPTTDDLYGM